MQLTLKFESGIGRWIGVFLAIPLLFCSYILTGGGLQTEGRYGAMAITVGIPLYFVSLTIARHTRLNWLIVLIAYVGALVGLVLVLILAASRAAYLDYGFALYVSFVFLVNVAGYFALVRRKKADGTGLQSWRGF